MSCTVASFITRFPEFCTVEEERVQIFLDDAALLMGTGEDRWLVFYDVAHCYHAAHLLVAGTASKLGDDGVLSPIKKQEVDEVVLENAIDNISATADDYNSTTYGKRYLYYRRIVFAGIIGV